MISGTSKISLILGLIIGHFWARRPCICGLSYTKILQKILESIWEHLGNILFFHVWQPTFSKCFERWTLTCFLNLFCGYYFCIFVEYIFVNYILRRWGIENDSFSINKIHKSLDMNFVCVRKHEQDFTLNFVFSWNVP